MAQEINLSLKSINPISHLENIGLGKRVFLVGNGPSLNDMDLDPVSYTHLTLPTKA